MKRKQNFNNIIELNKTDESGCNVTEYQSGWDQVMKIFLKR